MEGACGNVEDCWKGLRIGSTPKCLWNWCLRSELEKLQDVFGVEKRSLRDKGIPDQVDGLQEPYDGITKMIQTTLADTGEMNPGKSILVKVGVKLAHPETYSGGSGLKEFETFVTGILR